jgi:hypothetical protein
VAFFSSNRRRRLDPLVAGFALALWLAVAWTASCSKIVSLPDVDLQDPQWTIWEGQALWTPRSDLTAIAGDLIVAHTEDEDVLVSFSKSPFPIFTCQATGTRWRIDFIDKGRSYSGFGRPPKKFVWFHLPDMLDGASPPTKHWTVDQNTDKEWSLVNRKTGEKLLVVLH